MAVFIEVAGIIILIFSIPIFEGSIRVKRIVGGRPAARPPPDDPVVFIRLYDRYSRIEGLRNSQTGIYSFLGIRYADPPIGNNRFSRPRYRRPYGNINATSNGPPCPQPDPNNFNKVVGNEDCLLLNIFTQQMPDESTGLPVYVWIHPGGFRYGSAAQYGAEPLAQNGIIFIPVQYRLGTLGILGEGTKDLSGNLAMLDMTAALRWVIEYISFFGGNPKQIKVIGHGSGAASAMYLSMSKIPRSGGAHISGVVAMSGSVLSQYAADTSPVQSVEEIAAINECSANNKVEIIECMRKKTLEGIISRDSTIQTERLQGRAIIKGIAGNVGFSPYIEKPDDNRALPGFLTEQLNEVIKQGLVEKVPLLIGVVKHETSNGITVNTISKLWSAIENFFESLLVNTKNIKPFLGVDKNISEILEIGNFGTDLHSLNGISQELNTEKILSKVIEMTTDVLFSLPAALSAEQWSHKASSFLYSFEYNGTVSNGYNFLRGLPIVSRNKNSDYIGHGDELGYMFDVNDIFGSPVINTKLTSDEDLNTRQNLILLLQKFAQVGMSSESDAKDNIFLKLTGIGLSLIRITHILEVGNNFRFCDLSLLEAPIDAAKLLKCGGFLKQLKSMKYAFSNSTSAMTDYFRGSIVENDNNRREESIINVMQPTNKSNGNIFNEFSPF